MTDPASFRLQKQPLPIHIEEVIYHVRSESTTENGRRAAAPLPDSLELPAGSRWIEIHYTAQRESGARFGELLIMNFRAGNKESRSGNTEPA